LSNRKTHDAEASCVFALSNFLFRLREQTVSVLFFGTAGAKKSTKRNAVWKISRLRARPRALPVAFWMLNFAEIQHRVASLTLESIKTFTRHHPFLKKFDQNFREDARSTQKTPPLA
jgi:hypothetical protein